MSHAFSFTGQDCHVELTLRLQFERKLLHHENMLMLEDTTREQRICSSETLFRKQNRIRTREGLKKEANQIQTEREIKFDSH